MVDNGRIKLLVSAMPKYPEQCPFARDTIANKDRWTYCSILGGECSRFKGYSIFDRPLGKCECLQEVQNAGES